MHILSRDGDVPHRECRCDSPRTHIVYTGQQLLQCDVIRGLVFTGLRLLTARIFNMIFCEIKIFNILIKTFLRLMPLLSALFYASEQLITQVPPIM